MIDGWDIQTTSSDVRSDEYASLRRRESIKVLETLFLLKLGMEREDGHAEGLEEWDQTSDTVNGTNEDERSTWVSKEEVVKVEILLKRSNA